MSSISSSLDFSELELELNILAMERYLTDLLDLCQRPAPPSLPERVISPACSCCLLPSVQVQKIKLECPFAGPGEQCLIVLEDCTSENISCCSRISESSHMSDYVHMIDSKSTYNNDQQPYGYCSLQGYPASSSPVTQDYFMQQSPSPTSSAEGIYEDQSSSISILTENSTPLSMSPISMIQPFPHYPLYINFVPNMYGNPVVYL